VKFAVTMREDAEQGEHCDDAPIRFVSRRAGHYTKISIFTLARCTNTNFVIYQWRDSGSSWIT
jgi:hypothetical protein